jgi:hypothetical protein
MMRYIVVETYFIGRTVGVNCEQMIEFASKIKRANPVNEFALLKTISLSIARNVLDLIPPRLEGVPQRCVPFFRSGLMTHRKILLRFQHRSI